MVKFLKKIRKIIQNNDTFYPRCIEKHRQIVASINHFGTSTDPGLRGTWF